MTRISRRALALCAVAAALVFAGCAAPRMVVSEWSNPVYKSHSFKKFMVSCTDGHASIRRNCEDEFAVQLRPAGVEVLPTYRYVPEDGKVDEEKLRQAAKKAGAEALLMVRAVDVEQRTEVSPGFFPAVGFGIFGRNVSASWYPWYGASRVSRYEVYTSEATLYDLAKGEVVWTATLRTTMPDDVRAAIRSYVQEVVAALNQQNLLGVRH